MASLSKTQGLVAACGASIYFYKPKVTLPKERIKLNKGVKLSSVNCKKDKGYLFKGLIKAMLNDVDYDNTSSECMPLENADVERRSLQPAPYHQNASNLQSSLRFLEGILKMSRLQNFVPTMTLVLLGGWLGGERSMEVLLGPSQVWIAAWCSGIITVASMLVNDIFDFRSGTDQHNGRTSPLLKGQIHSYHVELVAILLYGTSIIGLCYLEPISLQLIIGVVIVTTYIYTPIFKNITMVKNMVVSGAISSSILVGALAAGGEGQLQNPTVNSVALFIFLCFLSREILMDVGDIVGDKAAGVNTLAVRFGGQICTLIASICLVAANALLISSLVVKAKAFATIGTLILLPLHGKILTLWKELRVANKASSQSSIHQVVQQSILYIGFGALVLAFEA